MGTTLKDALTVWYDWSIGLYRPAVFMTAALLLYKLVHNPLVAGAAVICVLCAIGSFIGWVRK